MAGVKFEAQSRGTVFQQEFLKQSVACQIGNDFGDESQELRKFTLQRHLDMCICIVLCVYTTCRLCKPHLKPGTWQCRCVVSCSEVA